MKTWIFLALTAALLVLAGFLRPMHVKAQSTRDSMTFGGITRTYHVYRPAALSRDAAAPLVVVLHGGFGTGAQAERAYHWDAAADAHGFVVLYPDGLRFAWNAGLCCGYPQAENIDDVGFLTTLIAKVIQSENIDPHRVYATGISNGAFMSYRLACESSFQFAAIGPDAGTLDVPCEHPKPTSVLAIHGLEDKNVPFNGGVGVGVDKSVRPSVPSSIARWRAIDHCAAPRTTSAPPVHTEISQCAEGRTVELITIDGAGHQWPGSEPPAVGQIFGLKLDQPSHALDATAVFWEFFAAHRS
ncbi:MAG: polyhydroxybutyrate depolymerase [Candidatus Eremiobacteraeota bacterium]|nr:polyhydroxybutyrate depolymerase [Candidatus Eremiobacteraeota bacterium]